MVAHYLQDTYAPPYSYKDETSTLLPAEQPCPPPISHDNPTSQESLKRRHPPRCFPYVVGFVLIVASIWILQHIIVAFFQDTPSPFHNPASNLVVSNYTCTPSSVSSCWPMPEEWQAFNTSISGRLQATIPWAAPCYSDSKTNATICSAISSSYTDSDARSAQYGAMEYLNWETCGMSSCSLNSFDPSAPVTGSCGLGRLSSYYVEAKSAEDVKKTLELVRHHGIRLSIKNTGHDYFGRSSGANTLAIWTHQMQDIEYHETFQPNGCKVQYEHIGEIGAGVQAQAAWEYFEEKNMLVIVGAVGSVGLAGGFGQAGGHGPLGPKYGLMVDQAVEFDVVTADGELRTINECSDPDLFWAMRGGGGGTYAVLVSYKFRLQPAVPLNVYSFQASFPAVDDTLDITKSAVHHDIVRALASNQTLFAENGVAGYNFLFPDHLISLQVLPSTDSTAIQKLTAQWHDFLSSYPGLNITDNTYHIFPKFSEWHAFTEQPSIADNGAVGIGLAESGRYIPKSHFSTDDSIDSLTTAVLEAMQISYTNNGGGAAQLYATGPFNTPDAAHKTSAHPGWRDSYWEVIMGGGWTQSTPPETVNQIQNTIAAAIQPFKTLTPGGGCYLNEGNWMEDDWQKTFFGEKNYADLLEVKRKWDPTGLFNCWKCVGWTGYEDPMYSCYTQTQSDPNPTIPQGPLR